MPTRERFHSASWIWTGWTHLASGFSRRGGGEVVVSLRAARVNSVKEYCRSRPTGYLPVFFFFTDRVFTRTPVSFTYQFVVNTFGVPLKVGRALKSVDARLLSEWTTWTGGNFPPAHCQVSKAQTIAQMHTAASISVINGRESSLASRTVGSPFSAPLSCLKPSP